MKTRKTTTILTILNTLLAATFMLIMVSCGSSDDPVDTEAPTITLHEPASSERFASGSEMHFEAEFEDNEGLATYNLTIHDNFDGHDHGRLAVSPFSYEESFDISGTYVEVEEHVDITADATAGPYHLIVRAIDAAGNATDFADDSSVEIEVWITNDEMAVVHFEDETGEEIDELEAEPGVALQIFGEVEDQEGDLSEIIISVGHLEEGGEHHHDGRVELEDHLFEEEYDVTGSSVRLEDLLANESIIVTESDLEALEEGEHLSLVVVAIDVDGNISQFSIEIHLE